MEEKPMTEGPMTKGDKSKTTKQKSEKSKLEKLYQAKLELIATRRDHCRFRITQTDGDMPVLDLAHLDIPRNFFPVDDDFSMSFMTSDLDDNATDEQKEKQARFKAMTSFRLLIGRMV